MSARFLTCLVVSFLLSLSPLQAKDNKDLTFFRIGTGGLDGVYNSMGAYLSNAISHPPGMPTCRVTTNCGVPGLVAVAQSTNGSVSNLHALMTGELDSAFVQADILYWAYEGKGLFADDEPKKELRVLSSLYRESVHLIVNKWSNIKSIEDLKGRRVSIGVKDSDSYVQSRLILDTFGITLSPDNTYELPILEAAHQLKEARIDAFFLVTGHPSQIIASLAEEKVMEIVPIDGVTAQRLQDQYSFFRRSIVPAGIYEGVGEIATLSVPTIWVTTTQMKERLAYQLLRALWHENTRRQFEQSNDVARDVTYATSFDGVVTPLHEGALLFHEELEMLKKQRQFVLDHPQKEGFDFTFGAFADPPKEDE